MELKKLEEMGWRVFVIWQCEVKRDPEAVLMELCSDIIPSLTPKTREARCRNASRVFECCMETTICVIDEPERIICLLKYGE